jgi:hypothetical protein
MRKLKRYLALGTLLGGMGWGATFAYHHPETFVGQCVRRACEMGLHSNPLYALGQGLADGARSRAEAGAVLPEEKVDDGLLLDPTPLAEEPLPSAPIPEVPPTIVIREDERLLPPVVEPMQPAVPVVEQPSGLGEGVVSLPAMPIPVQPSPATLMPYCPADDQPGRWMPYTADTDEPAAASTGPAACATPEHATAESQLPFGTPPAQQEAAEAASDSWFTDTLKNALMVWYWSCWGAQHAEVQEVPPAPEAAPEINVEQTQQEPVQQEPVQHHVCPDPHAGCCPYTGRCRSVPVYVPPAGPEPEASEPAPSESAKPAKPANNATQAESTEQPQATHLDRILRVIHRGISGSHPDGLDTMEFRPSDYQPNEHRPGPF